MAQEEFENPASDRPHVPRPWNDDMAAVNLYDDNGCSGHEFTLNVIYGVEEGCWNVNNVQSLSAIENGCWTKTYSGRDCQIDDCTFRVPEPACFNRAPKSIRIKCERNRNQMLDDPIFQSNAGDNYKGLGNPLDDHGPGQPSGNFPSEPPPGTPGVQVHLTKRANLKSHLKKGPQIRNGCERRERFRPPGGARVAPDKNNWTA
ncbi:MAG: hypothetical protein LQ352_006813 [Teloschistes flavicans]|nr:MAG: hypothetical protein LQ352_006813 [Teloschistes flavicans]